MRGNNVRSGECAFCTFGPVIVSDYSMTRNWPPLEEAKTLCDCCAGTDAGNAYEYGDQYTQSTVQMLRAISFATNLTLSRLSVGGPMIEITGMADPEPRHINGIPAQPERAIAVEQLLRDVLLHLQSQSRARDLELERRVVDVLTYYDEEKGT